MADSILIASGKIQLKRPSRSVTIHLHTDGVKVDKENTNAQGDFFADITARLSNTVRIKGEGLLFFKNTSVIPNETLPLPTKLEYGVADLKITIQPIQIPMNRVGASFEDIKIVFTQNKGESLKMESGSATMIVLRHGEAISTTDTHRNEVPLNLSLLDSGIVATLKEETKIRIPFIGKEQRVGDKIEGMSVLKEIIIPDKEDSVFVMNGTFRLDNAPEQLDSDLDATFDLVRENPTITIQKKWGTDEIDEGKIREELNIQALDLTWTLRDAPNETVSRKWEVKGNVTTSFWKNEVKMTPTMLDMENADNQTNTKKRVLSLTSTESPVTIGLEDWGSFDFTKINLKAVKNGSIATWALSSEATEAFTILPKLRHRAFDLFSDCLLEAYQLGLTDTDLVLQGRWLEEDLTFVGKRSDTNLIMEATTEFMLPFDYDLPGIIAPQTGVTLFEEAVITNQEMTTTLDLALTRNGLLTKVNSHFQLKEKDGKETQMAIPSFTLFTPPPSKNALLGHILSELEMNINEMSIQQRGHAKDFYLTKQEGQLVISLRGKAATVPATLAALTESHEPTNLFPNESIAYDQLLTYYYGWNKAKNYIDLVPGMRLRVDFQNYQFVQASDQSARRGFSGSGSTYYYVNSYLFDNKTLLGFDTFLSNVQLNEDATISKNGGGGLVDILRNGDRKKLFRLFYPNKPGTGIGPERVANIIGTDSYSLLKDATTQVVDNGSITPTDTVTSFYFKGRATIIPEIPVFVGEQMIYVSVGTTWRQLLERFTDIPLAVANQDLSSYASKYRPLRLLQQDATSQPTYVFINPPEKYLEHMNGNQDIFDLPLVKGDRFVV